MLRPTRACAVLSLLSPTWSKAEEFVGFFNSLKLSSPGQLLGKRSLWVVVPEVFSGPGTEGFLARMTFFLHPAEIGYILQVVVMEAWHRFWYSYMIKIIVSWLLWSCPRCQWLCAQAALQLGLESSIAVCLDLEAVGVWFAACPSGALLLVLWGCAQLCGYCALQLCSLVLSYW